MKSSVHDVVPVSNPVCNELVPIHDEVGKGKYGAKLTEELRIFNKWVGLWRTIILSSLGRTFYPYSSYMRTLNLRDLEEMFMDFRFGAATCR